MRRYMLRRGRKGEVGKFPGPVLRHCGQGVYRLRKGLGGNWL